MRYEYLLLPQAGKREVELDIPPDKNGTIGIEYAQYVADSGGVASGGTILIEANISGRAASPRYALKITRPDGSQVDTLAAHGIGYTEVTSWEKVWVRMSVDGPGTGLRVFVNFQTP